MRYILIFILLLFSSRNLLAEKYPKFPSWAYLITSVGQGDVVVETSTHHIGLLNEKYKILIDTVWNKYGGFYYDAFDNPVIFFKKNESNNYNDSCHGGWMLLNRKGVPVLNEKLRLPFDLEGLGYFSPGQQLGVFQCENGYWGICNYRFEILQPPLYSKIWILLTDTGDVYNKAYFLVKTNEKYGIIDTAGKLLLDTIYTAAYRPNDQNVTLANESDTLIFRAGHQGATIMHCNVGGGNGGGEWTSWNYYKSMQSKSISTNSSDSSWKKLKISASLYEKVLSNTYLENQMKYCPYDYYGEYIYLLERQRIDGFVFGDCTIPSLNYPYYQEKLCALDTNYFSFYYGFQYVYLNYMKSTKTCDYRYGVDTSIIVANDSMNCLSYSVRGNSYFPITLDSLFKKSNSLKDDLLARITKTKNDSIFFYSDSVYLADKFLILPHGVEFLFCRKENEKIYYYPEIAEWKNLSDLIDPKGPVRNKIISKKPPITNHK